MSSLEELTYAAQTYQGKIGHYLCPKCGNVGISVIVNSSYTGIAVKCSVCNHQWNYYQEFMQDYKCTQKIKSMRNILDKNRYKPLKDTTKKIKDLLINYENIITKEDYLNYISNNSNSLINKYNNLYEIKNILMLCSRIELLIMEEIINLAILNPQYRDFEIIVPNGKTKTFHFIQITNEESIIFTITEKLQLNNTRKIIRQLCAKGIISVNEEENFILIDQTLLHIKDFITNLLKPNLDFANNNDIEYLVARRNGFKCSCCGETGIKLIPTYLSKNKNKNDIKFLIPLCPVCYNTLTIDSVIIDGTVAIFNDYKFRAWSFITSYYPQLSSNNKFCNTFFLLALKYGEDNLIKATAITMNNISEGKILIKELLFFLKYIVKILDNSKKNNIEIDISKVKDKYGLNKWIGI